MLGSPADEESRAAPRASAVDEPPPRRSPSTVTVAGQATHGEYALVEACVAAAPRSRAHVAQPEDVVLHVLHGELERRRRPPRAARSAAARPRSWSAASRAESIATRPTRVLALITPAGLEQLLTWSPTPPRTRTIARRCSRSAASRPSPRHDPAQHTDRPRRRSRARAQRHEGAAGRRARPGGDRRGRPTARTGVEMTLERHPDVVLMDVRDAGHRRHRGHQAASRPRARAPRSSCVTKPRRRPARAARAPRRRDRLLPQGRAARAGSPRPSGPSPRATRCSPRRSPAGSWISSSETRAPRCCAASRR